MVPNRAPARPRNLKPVCTDRGQGLSAHLPALLHYGCLRGVPLEVLVELATRSPARVYGIYPQKGTIAVDSDAPGWSSISKLERVVDAQDLQGMSDFSSFEGKRLRGWPVATIKGGKIIARDGKIVANQTDAICRASPPPPSISSGSSVTSGNCRDCKNGEMQWRSKC
jgi:hypothetical protein